MAYQTTQARMVLAYGNRATQDYVSTVTTTNIAADAGFPATNLAYDDPSLKLKTSATRGTNRHIEFTFSASQQLTAFGIANHNLASQGYETIDVGYWNGSAFVSCGGGAATLGADDSNFLLRFAAQSSTRWQITLGKSSGTRPAFYLGFVFFGVIYEVETNPNDGGVFYSQDWQSDPLVAMGGTKYERPVSTREEESAEFSFSRISPTMAQVLRAVRATNRGKVVGIIPPDQVASVMPTGNQHLFGRLTTQTTSPRHGLKYDATIGLRGIQ